jgi:hypothetical protein
MIIKVKALEIGEFHFKNTFEHICFKHVFDLENHELKKCVYNKSHSFLSYLNCGCIIYKWYRPRYRKK